jgi:hypothetical protein
MSPFVLIVITYLGGSAWGPQISQQEYTDAKKCAAAKQIVLDTITELSKSNLVGGSPHFRQIVRAECVQK